ncbi:MAG: glycosyltransferase family 9 protein [Dysgonomonas sp.]|nr:glycosyltransferase family 9 protein [Dysgonomonas sp.]
MEIRKILVIRFRRVGDATLSVALCTSLRKSFPHAEIHYVLNENIAPLFSGHPDIDKIITFSDYDMAKITRYVKKVKTIVSEEKYDIIIDTRATIKTLFFSVFSLNTPYRIGRKKEYNLFFHNFRVDNYPDGIRDNLTLTLELLNPLTKHFEIIKDSNFKLNSSETEKQSYKEYLQSKGLDLEKPIIVCAVTARKEGKVWPKDKMGNVLNRVIQKYPTAQLIFNYGGEREKNAAISLYEYMGKPESIFIDIEAKSLIEFKALLSFSDFFFGNEGGPRHIAQALNVPTFAIYPPCVKKAGWLPNPSPTNLGIELHDINPKYAEDKTLSYEEKLNLIDEDSVWEKLDIMLQQNIYLEEKIFA